MVGLRLDSVMTFVFLSLSSYQTFVLNVPAPYVSEGGNFLLERFLTRFAHICTLFADEATWVVLMTFSMVSINGPTPSSAPADNYPIPTDPFHLRRISL